MRDLYDYLNDVSVDFSQYGEEELTQKERSIMKRAVKGNGSSKRKIWTVGIVAATVVALGVTSYATGFIDNIIKSVSTGYNSFAQVSVEGQSIEMPAEIAGLVFNADGSPAKEIASGASYYDADGNEIKDWNEFFKKNNIDAISIDGDVVYVSEKAGRTADPLENASENDYVVKSMADLEGKTAFAVKAPASLPEGFEFYGATCNKDGGEYLFLYYMNEAGDWFTIHERLINEETAFASATDGTVEETDINGHKAAIVDGSSVEWEADGISVGIMGRGYIEKDELISMAKGM